MPRTELPSQSLAAKKAEFERPFEGAYIISDDGLSAMMRQRAEKMLLDASELATKGVSFGPFLEMGAGNGQRSLALMNRYSVPGMATDISANRLRNVPYVRSLLSCGLSPELVCCDAHHLPFLPATFSFVFAYQTLHHFDDPSPVLAECYRVLGRGGHLFFNEEPLDTPVKRLLRGNRVLSNPPTRLQALAGQLGPVQRLFWDDGAFERSLGMTEARFGMRVWQEALKPFPSVELEISNYLRIRTDLRTFGLNYLLAGMLGGNVRGLCRKSEGEAVTDDIHDRLMCIRCNSRMRWPEENAPHLRCHTCDRTYPIRAGILAILPEDVERMVYPDGPARV